MEVIRHSTAHLLAQAVKQLFPGAQVTIGPVIDNGFYYDFAYERPFTPEDLDAIERKMGELAQADTRRKSLKVFRRTRRSPSIDREILKTSAAGRTCPQRESSNTSS